jgi:ketosteroid isomerase-like protein
MKRPHTIIRLILISFLVLCCSSILTAQITQADSVLSVAEIQKARTDIESIEKQFSKDFLNGDSVALAAYYTEDAQFGSLKGEDILSAWGRMIRNSIKNNTQNLTFKITSLSGDHEFLVELGIFESKDDNNNLISKGKYVVVWKQEKGKCKIYRDLGL